MHVGLRGPRAARDTRNGVGVRHPRRPRELDLQRSPLVRALCGIRTLPSCLRGEREQERPRAFLAETLSIGWGMLAEVPERAIVVGAVTQPWEPIVLFHSIPPAELAGFNEPGYAKIIWSLAADPIWPAESLFRTETRMRTTDLESPATGRCSRRASCSSVLTRCGS
jgi:hypothetical protein